MNIKKLGTAIAAMLLASVGIVGCAQEDLDRSGCEQATEADVDLKAPKTKAPKGNPPKTAKPAPAPKVNPAPAPKSGGKR